MKQSFSYSVIGTLMPTLLGLLLLLILPMWSMARMEALHRHIENDLMPAHEAIDQAISTTYRLRNDFNNYVFSLNPTAAREYAKHKKEWKRATQSVPVRGLPPATVLDWQTGVNDMQSWIDKYGDDNIHSGALDSDLPGEPLYERGLTQMEDARSHLAQTTSDLRGQVRDLEKGALAATGGLGIICVLLVLLSWRNAVVLQKALAAESRNADRLVVAVKETNHRVKNNLQTIGALIDMNRHEYDADIPRRILDEIYQQVQTVAAVHDFLSYEQQGSQVAIRPLLDKLVTLMASTQEMKTEVRASALDLPVKAATAIALIVNELMLNAGKHGAKCVQVELSTRGSECVLCVSDDGPGLPSHFSVDKHGNLGTMLVQTLARHDLGGDVQWRNGTVLSGACIEIAFPMPASLR